MIADVSKVPVVQLIARQDAALNVFSMACGGIAALAGIGGSTLFTPYFKATGMEAKQAVGTSAALGLPVSMAGAIGYAWAGRNVHISDWAVGFVYVPALVALVAGAFSDRSGRRGARAPALRAHAIHLLRALPVRQRRPPASAGGDVSAVAVDPMLDSPTRSDLRAASSSKIEEARSRALYLADLRGQRLRSRHRCVSRGASDRRSDRRRPDRARLLDRPQRDAAGPTRAGS